MSLILSEYVIIRADLVTQKLGDDSRLKDQRMQPGCEESWTNLVKYTVFFSTNTSNNLY